MDFYLSDLLFYGFDLIVLVLVGRMVFYSKEVELETKTAPIWVMPLIIWVLAVAGWFRSTGSFKWIQTTAILCIGMMYLFMKSGLSKRGMVSMGRLFPYAKMDELIVDYEDESVVFYKNHMPVAVHFLDQDMKDVEHYLRSYSNVMITVRKPKKH